MPQRKLKETLDELHGQLESAGHIDDAARERLRAAMNEIREVLERSAVAPKDDAVPDEDAGPIDRLEQLVEHFEEDHPNLTARIVDLVESLRGMGF